MATLTPGRGETGSTQSFEYYWGGGDNNTIPRGEEHRETNTTHDTRMHKGRCRARRGEDEQQRNAGSREKINKNKRHDITVI